jgi:hypothetical protein
VLVFPSKRRNHSVPFPWRKENVLLTKLRWINYQVRTLVVNSRKHWDPQECGLTVGSALGAIWVRYASCPKCGQMFDDLQAWDPKFGDGYRSIASIHFYIGRYIPIQHQLLLTVIGSFSSCLLPNVMMWSMIPSFMDVGWRYKNRLKQSLNGWEEAI